MTSHVTKCCCACSAQQEGETITRLHNMNHGEPVSVAPLRYGVCNIARFVYLLLKTVSFHIVMEKVNVDSLHVWQDTDWATRLGYTLEHLSYFDGWPISVRFNTCTVFVYSLQVFLRREICCFQIFFGIKKQHLELNFLASCDWLVRTLYANSSH